MPRNASPARSAAPSRDKPLPSGKENARPATRRKPKEPEAGSRVSLVWDRRGRKVVGGARERSESRTRVGIADSFLAKKAPFTVLHCEEERSASRKRGVAKRSRSRTRSPCGSAAGSSAGSSAGRVATPGTDGNERTLQVRAAEAAPLQLSRKGEAWDGGSGRRPPPSKIPRRANRDSGSSLLLRNATRTILARTVATRSSLLLGNSGRVRDEAAASSSPSKAAVRRANLAAAKLREEAGDRSPTRNLIPAELYYNVEYHNDLPVVEREREERAPRLSDNFLRHVNAEQRKLVVMFALRLGTHCQYPSFVVYQAVKLFDAAMDRIRVETEYIQLAILASLWIALKAQQNFHQIPTATTMVALARDLYADREDLLAACERKILQALNFNVTFADAFSLYAYHLINCRRYVDVPENTTTFLYYCGGYAIDVTLLDEQFCRTSTSLLALTAAELVLGVVLDGDAADARPRWMFWRGLLFTGAHRGGRFQDEEMDRCRVAMLRRILDSGRKHRGFEVVYKKYSRSRYCRISAPFLDRVTRISRVESYDP